MTISPTAFAAGLYREHLEEISFLYEQRMTLLDDPRIQWPDIADFENRLEAHLDALMVGGRQAADICLKKVQTGDAGERYGALRLLCRRGEPDTIIPLIPGLSKADDDIGKAVGDALICDMPAEWAAELMMPAREEPAACASIVSRVIGFKRLHPPDGFAALLADMQQSASPEAIWAAGRLRDRSAERSIRPFIEHSDPALAATSVLTLLRLGQPDVLATCLKADPALTWSSLLLGIGGGPRHLSPLVQQGASPEALTGMGLLGHIDAVDALLSALEDEDRKAHAAAALQMITGAGLEETNSLPGGIDGDELPPEDIEKRQRDRETSAVPERSVNAGTGPSQDPERWRQWWADNRKAFRSDLRYRNGEVFSPSLLVGQMASRTAPRWLRQLAYEELVVRYDVDFAFETEMTAMDQAGAISSYRTWAAGASRRFEDGEWYFSGSSYR